MASVLTSRISSWLGKRRRENDEKVHQVKRQRITQENEVKIAIFDKESIGEDHGMGWFISLPTELLHMVFQYLDKESLLLVSSLSKHLNTSVLNYFLSTPGFTHLIKGKTVLQKDCALFQLIMNPVLFKDAGKLLGSICAYMSVTKRLRIMCHFKRKMEKTSSELISTIVSAKSNECLGQFFSNYVSDWSIKDKKKAYSLFSRKTKLEQKIDRALRFCPGTLPWHERELRELLLHIFLLPTSCDKEYGFWLTQILHSYAITHQARLLYILAGPTDQAGFVCWYCTCGCIESVAAKGDKNQYDLSELARAFQVLLGRSSDWSIDDIISIFQELTTIPCGWCLEKVACLLVKSGDELSRAVIGNKAANSHIAAEELSLMLHHMAHYCFNGSAEQPTLSKWYVDLLMYTVRQIRSKKERRQFTSSLLTSWHDCCSILFDEQYNSGDDGTGPGLYEVSLQFHSSITSLTKLTKLLLDRLLEI